MKEKERKCAGRGFVRQVTLVAERLVRAGAAWTNGSTCTAGAEKGGQRWYSRSLRRRSCIWRQNQAGPEWRGCWLASTVGPEAGEGAL